MSASGLAGRPEHAALYARKVLAARIAVLQAFDCGECVLENAEEQLAALDASEALLTKFRTPATGRLVGEPPREEALDEFLLAQSRLHVAIERNRAESASHPNLAARLATLEAELASFDCLACAKGKRDEICADGEHDRDTVAKGGECLRHLKAIFAWALELARIAYDEFAPGVEAKETWTKSVAVVLETAANDKLEPLLETPRLAACVQFAAAGNKRFSFVRFTFAPNHFDAKALQLCPYLLAHELIAHAFLAAGARSAVRRTAYAEDGWAEGWMDAVAYLLLDRAVMAHAPYGAQALPSWLDSVGVQAQSAGFHKARYFDANFGFARRVLTADRAAFFAIYERLARTSAPGVPQHDVLLRASLLINAAGAPARVTRQLMASAQFFSLSRGNAPLTPQERSVLASLVRFLGHRSLAELAADLGGGTGVDLFRSSG